MSLEADPDVSLELQCAGVAAVVFRTVLEDATWQRFGYRRRPRCGALFQWMIPLPERERRIALTRELTFAALAEVVAWARSAERFLYREIFTAKVVGNCLDGVGSAVSPIFGFRTRQEANAAAIWPTLGFHTRDEAIEHLGQALRDYGDHSDKQRPSVFFNRCKDQVSHELPSRFLMGAAWLFVLPDSDVHNMRSALNLSGIASVQECDIAAVDESLIRKVKIWLSGIEIA